MKLSENIFIHSAAAEFTGTHAGTNIGSGVIQLDSVEGNYPQQGAYTSKVIQANPFRNLVMSWNADTPQGTYVVVEARVQLTDGTWSQWMSWGKWGRTVISAMAKTEDDHVKVDADTLAIKDAGSEAVALQYRVNLHSESGAFTPTVYLIAGALRNPLANRKLTKLYDATTINRNQEIDLSVPQYSQYRRDLQFAHGICSPTCLAMVMEYFGKKYLVEEVVRATWDDAYGGYGNWSFNAAVAGSYGFSAYVAYYTGEDDTATIDLVRQELAHGQPIIASVRYKNSPEVERNLPVLDNAPIPSTPGHLVLIRGIKEKEGGLYFIVNDPAASEDAAVRREYRADQFLTAWTQKVVYIVKPNACQVEMALPKHLPARLTPTGQSRDKDGVVDYEYALVDEHANEISLSNNGSRHHICIVHHAKDGTINYIAPQAEDTIWLSNDLVNKGGDFTILFNAGKVYRAHLTK